MGATTAAARAGAPQVVIPQMYDQHYWAQRIHHLGIGTAHAPGTPTTDSLTLALERTLQPESPAFDPESLTRRLVQMQVSDPERLMFHAEVVCRPGVSPVSSDRGRSCRCCGGTR